MALDLKDARRLEGRVVRTKRMTAKRGRHGCSDGGVISAARGRNKRNRSSLEESRLVSSGNSAPRVGRQQW